MELQCCPKLWSDLGKFHLPPFEVCKTQLTNIRDFTHNVLQKCEDFEFHKNDAWMSEISLSCFRYHTQDDCCNCLWHEILIMQARFALIVSKSILFLKLNQLLLPHFTAAMELHLHVPSLANLWRPWSISQLCDPVCMFCYHWEKLLVAAFHVWKLQIQNIFTFCNSILPVLIDYAVLNSHEEKGFSLWFSMSFSNHPDKCICILSIPEHKSRRYAESFLMCFTLPVPRCSADAIYLKNLVVSKVQSLLHLGQDALLHQVIAIAATRFATRTECNKWLVVITITGLILLHHFIILLKNNHPVPKQQVV